MHLLSCRQGAHNPQKQGVIRAPETVGNTEVATSHLGIGGGRARARVISLGKEAARNKHHQTEPFSIHAGREVTRNKELKSSSASVGPSMIQPELSAQLMWRLRLLVRN